MPRKIRILFACEGNTCRSLMAEHIARAMFGDTVEPTSAGFAPQKAEDAANAIHTLASLKIDAVGHVPRDIRHLDVSGFDLVIAMDENRAIKFRAHFTSYPAEHLVTWDIRDPFGGDLGEYETCARLIQQKLSELSYRWRRRS